MRSWLIYTAARLGLFVGAFGVVYLFGARSWIAIILAWVISGLASYVLLSTWRDRLSTQIVDRGEKRKGARLADRLDGGASREDRPQETDEEPEAAEGRTSAEEAPSQGVEEGTTPAKED